MPRTARPVQEPAAQAVREPEHPAEPGADGLPRQGISGLPEHERGRALDEHWQRLLARAHQLDAGGATRTGVGDPSRWAVGDAVAAMTDFIRAVKSRALEEDGPAARGLNSRRQGYDAGLSAFLHGSSVDVPQGQRVDVPQGQRVDSLTLRDYARVAAAFPAGHPVRGVLTFAHARALRTLDTDAERRAWARRALAEGLAVNPLRAAINAERAARGGAGRGVFRCAGTGRRITDLASMATLSLNVLPALRPGLPPERRPPPAAHTPGGHDATSVLRFRDLAALRAWIDAHLDTTDRGGAPVVRRAHRRPARGLAPMADQRDDAEEAADGGDGARDGEGDGEGYGRLP